MSIAKISGTAIASIGKFSSTRLEGLDSYAHYKLNDDAANTTVTDDGTGANDGVASVNTENLSVAGKINKAFDFNGIDEYINLDALESDIHSDTTGSFSFWVDFDSVDSTKCIFGLSSTSSTDEYFLIRMYGTANQEIAVSLYYLGNPIFIARGSTSCTVVDGWYHIAVVQNGTELKIYVNGVAETITWDSQINKGSWINVANTNIGRIGYQKLGDSADANWFDGKIDDFRYYKNVALTESQIINIYNEGNGTESEIIGIDKILGITK